MLFVNRSKLLGAIAESGMKKKELADELCITNTALALKLKGSRHFREEEIVVLSRLFGKNIFFEE